VGTPGMGWLSPPHENSTYKFSLAITAECQT
jgi:hypothetical protein